MIGLFRVRKSIAGVLIGSIPVLMSCGALFSSDVSSAEDTPPAPPPAPPHTACALSQSEGTAENIVRLKDGSVLFLDRQGDDTSSWRLFNARQMKTDGVAAPAETLKDGRLTSGLGVRFVLPNGTVLMKGGYLWVLYDPVGRRLVPLNIPNIIYIVDVLPIRSSPDLAIVANNGLYRYNFATDRTTQVLSFGEGTDPLMLLRASSIALSNDTLLLATEAGLFSFDGQLLQLLKGPSRTFKAWDKDTALIISGQDWYAYYASDKKLERLTGMPKFGLYDEIHTISLPNHDLLIEGNDDLYFVGSFGAQQRLLHQQRINLGETWTFPNGDFLFPGHDIIYRFSALRGVLGYAQLQSRPVVIPVADGYLVGDAQANAWYVARSDDLRFMQMQLRIAVDAYKGEQAADGSTILYGGNAVYKYISDTGAITLIAQLPAKFRPVSFVKKRLVFLTLEDTHEWRVLDVGTGKIRSIGIARPRPKKPKYYDDWKAGEDTTFELASGEVLIQTRSQDLYRFSEGEPSITPIMTPDDMQVLAYADGLQDRNTILRGLNAGVYFLPFLPLSDADVTPVEPALFDRPGRSDKPIKFTVSMSHPCAPVAKDMKLHFEVRRGDDPPANVDADFLRTTASTAAFAGLFTLDEPGKWQLQLADTDVKIGNPISFVVAAPTLLQRINDAKGWIALLSTLVCAAIFASLIVMSHWSATAFRLLSDTVWAKWLTWPFFFLRHVQAVQRWILAPWFNEARKSVNADSPYIDPPVRSGNSQMLGSMLLERLTQTSRIWLRGESGMGKSSVFAAWERAYFSQHGSLGAALKRFRFILVPLRLREFADIAVPDPNRPETWLVEAVRRSLERAGFRTQDRNLIEAMLNAGQFALALDGVNEVDRGTSVEAFAAQFRMVPIIATSRSLPVDSWQTWQLPPDVRGLQIALLALWLGRERAAILAKRIKESGLGDSIASGYDVRLLADLFADEDPRELPGNRVELYLAILGKAGVYAAEPLRLEGLKRLAWTMLVRDGRREIRSADVSVVGRETLLALARDNVRVVRRNGPDFEFRHDQMRAFLAALWLVDDSASQSGLEAALINDAAFDLGRSEQQELWDFVGLLVEDEPLASLWRFAIKDPERRSLLIAALQREAEAREMELTMALSSKR